jgi:hypothetical protein
LSDGTVHWALPPFVHNAAADSGFYLRDMVTTQVPGIVHAYA